MAAHESKKSPESIRSNHSIPSIPSKREMLPDTAVQSSLVKAAREAACNAYCPYSNYPVGAAVLTLDGQIYTGCNVENVSYGLSTCAERTALFKAVSVGCRSFAALAVAGGTEQAASPCGACRQVLAEFCVPEMPVFFARLHGGRVTVSSVGELLPHAFQK